MPVPGPFRNGRWLLSHFHWNLTEFWRNAQPRLHNAAPSLITETMLRHTCVSKNLYTRHSAVWMMSESIYILCSTMRSISGIQYKTFNTILRIVRPLSVDCLPAHSQHSLFTSSNTNYKWSGTQCSEIHKLSDMTIPLITVSKYLQLQMVWHSIC